MREAIGSTWLIGIVITFVAIFSAFLAYSISYTKAFKVKNEIVNIIEKNEGFSKSANNLDNVSDDTLRKDMSTEAQIFKYIKSIGYNYSAFENGTKPCNSMYKGGYCLEKYCVNNGERNVTYYKVTSYITLSIPVINFNINLPIKGETQTLQYDSTSLECTNINMEVN